MESFTIFRTTRDVPLPNGTMVPAGNNISSVQLAAIDPTGDLEKRLTSKSRVVNGVSPLEVFQKLTAEYEPESLQLFDVEGAVQEA